MSESNNVNRYTHIMKQQKITSMGQGCEIFTMLSRYLRSSVTASSFNDPLRNCVLA
jgi:hypothetical protein